MIQISRHGLHITASDEQLDVLAADFDTTRLIRLPRFFDADFGDLLERRLAQSTFTPRRDGDLVIEHTLANPDLLSACLFVLNDPALLRTIERLTKCGPLASFTGRIYRRSEPARAGEHYYEWHDDVSEGRRVVLSVNLGRAPYGGGALQLRDAITHEAIAEAADVSYLEALLIPVSDRLQHRVAPVTGSHPRTVLAGWFRAA